MGLHRTISNSLHYNLPRHSDHHMAATKDFWDCMRSSRLRCCPTATRPWHLFANAAAMAANHEAVAGGLGPKLRK